MLLYDSIHPQSLWQPLKLRVTLQVNEELTQSMPMHGLFPYLSLWQLLKLRVTLQVNEELTLSMPMHGQIYPQSLWQLLRLRVIKQGEDKD